MAAPLVQIALDFSTIGTPLIVSAGVRAVAALSQAFPTHQILADYKTMDSGFKNVLLTREHGGHYMTVCGNAPDETVRSAIDEGKKIGIQVVVDTIGVKQQAVRARQCAEWGADMIYLHYGADQRRADQSRDSTQWFEDVSRAVDIPVGVGTFGLADGFHAAQLGAALVAIGHPLISSDQPFENLRQYVEKVKSAPVRSR